MINIPENTIERFIHLRNKWNRETGIISSTTKILEHPCYAEIVSMGQEIIPLLIIDAHNNPSHICFALFDITGENPVKKEHAGMFAEIGEDWKEWGIKHGYVEESDFDNAYLQV